MATRLLLRPDFSDLLGVRLANEYERVRRLYHRREKQLEKQRLRDIDDIVRRARLLKSESDKNRRRVAAPYPRSREGARPLLK